MASNSHHPAESLPIDHCSALDFKRRRQSLRKQHAEDMTQDSQNGSRSLFSPDLVVPADQPSPDDDNAAAAFATSRPQQDTAENKDFNIQSTSRQAEKMITPFLTKHIPQQYNPLGGQPPPQPLADSANSRYCYRHRPDLKCRRQVNEPSMEQLQKELGALPPSDQQGISHVWSLFSAAPAKHRNLMLQGILAQCCFPQLSFVAASVRDLIKIDFLAALPPELGFKILCYLDTTSLCKAAQVSRRWRTLADDDVVWHRMCEQHIDRKCTRCGWGLPLLDRKRLRTEKRQIQLRATGRGLNEWSPDITPVPEPAQDADGQVSRDSSAAPTEASGKRPLETDAPSPELSTKRLCTQAAKEPECYFELRAKRPWKDVYKDRFKVGTNWRYGRHSTKIFRGHTNGIMCLQFSDNILATGSYDTTIKIWDMDTTKEIRTLTGHTAGIRCLQLEGCKLFSGSIDKTLKVWNWRTGECVRTFHGHTGGIISLHYSDNILASGSMDNTIRIYNLQDKSKFLLRGHTDWVNAVKIDAPSRTLFSASDDCTVRLWDLDTRQTIKIFKGHVGQVQQVVPLPEEFELDDEEALDALGEHDQSDDGSPSSSNSLAVPYPTPDPARPQPPKYMLTGSLDSTIRLWHVPSGRCIRTFFGHVEGIWALAADTLRLVSGAEDRMVKVWDPRSGHCERTFTGHAGPVTCVGLSDSRLATGSEDCEVRVYGFDQDS